MVYRKHTLDEHFFDVIDTESKAYWLGFLSADGSIGQNGAISLVLKASDAEHVKRFLEDIGSSAPTSFLAVRVKGKQYQTARASVCSKSMARSLADLGVICNKTFAISPCAAICDTLESHYWRGVFDGDGSISHPSGKRAYQLSLTGTRAMLEGFAAFASQHTHMRPSVLPIKGKRSFRVTYLGVAGLQALVRALYDGADTYLPRKKAVADEFLLVEPMALRTRPLAKRESAIERS